MNPLEELLQSPQSGLLRMNRLIAETPEDAKRMLLAAICNKVENSELRASALFILWTKGKELGIFETDSVMQVLAEVFDRDFPESRCQAIRTEILQGKCPSKINLFVQFSFAFASQHGPISDPFALRIRNALANTSFAVAMGIK